jgi:hypothetical protein
MSRLLFVATWLGSMGFLAACWTVWRELANFALKPSELATLSAIVAVAPWITGPGLLPWLRRKDSGGVNLPHADHWFSGERRQASLTRMSPYLDVLGLMVMALLVSQLGLDLWYAHQGLKAGDLLSLSLLGVFLAAMAMWTIALLRAFPKPDPAAAAAAEAPAPRRPRRPGEDR